MKKMKKLAALFMSIIMMMALATSASAADDGKITINNATSGTVYTVYKVFDLKSYDLAKNHYFFTVDSTWKDFVTAPGEGASYVTVDDGNYVFKNNAFSSNAAEFAKKAYTYASSHSIPATTTVTATGSTVEISDLAHGYYIVKSSRGDTLSAATVVSGGMVNSSGGTLSAITEKNTSLPYITKKVQDGSAWADSNVTSINSPVNFQITIAASEGGTKYVVEDTLGTGLTFDEDSVQVTYKGTNLTANTDYTVTQDGQKITFDLSDSCNGLSTNDEFVITYSATLNKSAVVAGEGNKNDVLLTYDGVTAEQTDRKDSTTTYTYQFTLTKTDDKGTTIGGAQFELKDSSDTTIKLTKDNDNKYYCDPSGSDPLTAGAVTVYGLGNGTYTITETKAPSGYIKANDSATVTINNANGSDVKIVNTVGTALPETGGMGTTIFYIAGSILMLGAAVLLLTKKRSKAE